MSLLFLDDRFFFGSLLCSEEVFFFIRLCLRPASDESSSSLLLLLLLESLESVEDEEVDGLRFLRDFFLFFFSLFLELSLDVDFFLFSSFDFSSTSVFRRSCSGVMYCVSESLLVLLTSKRISFSGSTWKEED